jgi:undecaprenyl-diphosphatase
MLMSIPVILAAGLVDGTRIYLSGDFVLGLEAALAAGLSFLVALAALAAMMAWLRRAGFGIFVLYRLALGGGILYWVYA